MAYKFRMLPNAGNHSDPDHPSDRRFFPGDVFESNHPLHQYFTNKFELLPPETEIPESGRFPQEGGEVVESSSTTSSATSSTTTPPPPTSDDVTSQFEGAEKAGLVVKKVGKKFSIYEAASLETPLDGGKELTEAKAKEFIASLSDE